MLFFFHFAPIWCLTSLFQHVNHRGDQWCRWIKECGGCGSSDRSVGFQKTKVMLSFIWFHLSFLSCWCLSSGRRKLHMGSSHKTWGRMLCVCDRERCFPSSRCSALTLTAGTYITLSPRLSFPLSRPSFSPVGHLSISVDVLQCIVFNLRTPVIKTD